MKAMILLLLLTGFTGCAFTNRENTPLLNQVEDHLWPEDGTSQFLLFPVIFPVGFAAIIVDSAIIHPVMVIDDAAEDTKEELWSNFEWDEKYVTECATLPWRIIFSPVIFTGSLLGRSLFDIPDKAERARREEERKKRNIEGDEIPDMDRDTARSVLQTILETVESDLDDGDPVKAARLLKDISFHRFDFYLPVGEWTAAAEKIQYYLLQAAWKSGHYDLIRLVEPSRMDWPPLGDKVKQCLEEMRQTDDPLTRWTARFFAIEFAETYDEKMPHIHEALNDPDPVARHAALTWIEHSLPLSERKKRIEKNLEERLERERDPINRALIRQLIDPLDG